MSVRIRPPVQSGWLVRTTKVTVSEYECWKDRPVISLGSASLPTTKTSSPTRSLPSNNVFGPELRFRVTSIPDWRNLSTAFGKMLTATVRLRLRWCAYYLSSVLKWCCHCLHEKPRDWRRRILRILNQTVLAQCLFCCALSAERRAYFQFFEFFRDGRLC